MTVRTSIAVLAGLLACAVLLPTPLRAYSYVLPTDQALVDGADGVLVAEVSGAPSAIDSAVLPQLSYPLRVVHQLRGRVAARQQLVLPGSIDPRQALHLPGVARLAVGERVLVAYVRRADGRIAPLHLSLGLFQQRIARSGERAYFRAIGDDGNQRKAHNAAFAAPRHADRFEQWIADNARGLKRAPDYLDPSLQRADAAQKFTLLIFEFLPPGVLPDGPARWAEFDDGQDVEWRAMQGGQANTSQDEFAAVQAALNAWENDPGSNIDFTYGGTTNADTDAFNTVFWNDAAGGSLPVIGAPYVCGVGGTLGIGGSSANSNEQIVDGDTYYTSRNGFVIIAANAGCYFDGNGGADGAEVLTHEIGHSLGFGHACGDIESPTCGSDAVLNAAVMRALAHGNGRGASLGLDDRAAAGFVYPSGVIPNPDLLFASGFE